MPDNICLVRFKVSDLHPQLVRAASVEFHGDLTVNYLL
jgi:hypothetical protein